MQVLYKIQFKTGIPSIEEIVEKLKINTGLQIESNTDELFEIDNTENVVFFYYQEKEIVLYIFGNKLTYLLGALIYTLKELGGYFSITLPEWASEKWANISKDFDSFPNSLFGSLN